MKKVEKMYVIDDDKIYHFLLKNLFRQNSIEATPLFFSNGQDAIDYIIENKNNVAELPELILLDVNMPIMDGWQFLEEYNQILDDLPKASTIFMISSSNDEQDLSKAKKYSNIVKDYFLKPICKEDLDKIFVLDRA